MLTLQGLDVLPPRAWHLLPLPFPMGKKATNLSGEGCSRDFIKWDDCCHLRTGPGGSGNLTVSGPSAPPPSIHLHTPTTVGPGISNPGGGNAEPRDMGVRGAFHLLLMCLSPALLSAVRINGDGQEVLYLAEGDSVKLGCPYILDPEDYGPSGLDIEWMQVNSDPSHRENVFLSYQDKRINHGNLPHLQQRVRFAASDPSQYDASINLMNLQVSDTATYECRVKKTTTATRKVVVTVQARPAVPVCWSEGHMAHGNDVVLKCFTNGGTPPLSYKWAKISGNAHPYRAGSYHSQQSFHSELTYQESFHSSINQGLLNNGDLMLKDVSHEDDGLYQCTVANHVGYSVCVVEVKVSDSRRVGVIIGAVLGSLLGLCCLLVGIWGLICCCCGGAGAGCGTRSAFGYSNSGEVSRGACSDLANEIREDAVAPGCKAGGRGSRVTHLLGYPTQTVSRSLRRKYAPPPSGGPEDVALAPRTAAACEAGSSPVYVKVTSAKPADCAQGSLPGKDGLLV
ncbi:V-set and immunoglobulin domain-containing protein 8 isoform X2 [Rousettus aegyptiacus]|uniref:V-set and immunoglobulin domain-containing protein 8 isoform X2 n=1 Tax=Rousettus aegyptiacus TaxID=9407 RepID=UPI0007882BB6|nr:V-set and immunoglobulin domain-containing protein 8 isoform X2 [Rousettus aegyptiacus]